MRRWCKKSDKFKEFGAHLVEALGQTHLLKLVTAETEKLDRDGERRGKAKAAGHQVEAELNDRNFERGWSLQSTSN